MTQVEVVLRRLDSDLGTARADWALIGGFALSARAEARFTRDIDLAVVVDDAAAAAEQLVATLLMSRRRPAFRVLRYRSRSGRRR